MTVADYFTWLGDPPNGIAPRRPTIADVGSDAYENVPGEEPDERYGVRAEHANQWSQQIPGLARVASPAKISVRINAGAPFVHSVATVRGDVLTSGITATDGGTGIVQLTWPADTFPPFITEPMASLNGTTAGMIAAVYIANGVEVRTFGSNGSAADLPFTVALG